MEPLTVGEGLGAFYKTEIKNIFNNPTLNISRSDANYIGLNTAYRAPVFFNECHQQSTRTWEGFKYFGHNHGDWIFYARVAWMFLRSIIHATADIQPYNGRHGYDIMLIGSGMGSTTNDTLTNDDVLAEFEWNTDGSTGTNIYVDGTDTYGFTYDSKIYARHACKFSEYLLS